MAATEYAAALKQGRRSYQTALTKGEYPYLPVLDDILSYTEVASIENLGVMDIPLSKIVGTKTAGRTNAFANNFMPLLPEDSEFGMKWASLYDHQIEDGIRDPIIAYEFMNQFYVQEGNKRVSVMKYLETYSIPGTVTRLVPRKSDEKENRLYYEFLDFYEVSQSYDVWFTKEGSYKKLLKLMGKKEDEMWDDDDRMNLHYATYNFAEAFKKAHGEKLDLQVSDAFLVYLEIYGYDNVKGETAQEMLPELQKMWTEITLADKGNQVELVQNPEETKETKSSILNRLIPTTTLTPESLKIAFIYMKTTDTSSWAYAHELGRMYIEQIYEGKLETMAFDKADTEEEVEAAIENAVEAGCNLIFTTATQMVNQSVRSAIKHPKVKIYNCSIKMSYSSICTYYARMYESKFLMGAIAAALSRTDRLGYVADYPIYGTLANINAFALGAKMINPYVEIYLEWSNVKGPDARERLQQEGIVFVSDSDMITPKHASRAYGLYAKKEDGTLENLATPIWHWGKFYERIVKNLCSGVSTEADAQKGKKAVNYWWGMSADVIDVICSQDMPHGTHRLIEFLKNSIRAGAFQPFDGPIYAQGGVVRCEAGKSLEPEEIITMDWLAENVIGHIPELEELTEEAQALVQFQGIRVDESNAE
ncbi:MAG: BMP family ABC transporter substrate-binding protein [Bacillus sp. (in: Bacteria)]|nr:BMP family ABC transporter substrate-binding protein [Bacillus sp. (in: firmicutes)]MCM1426581.1 BMP family ABC transporter substrate-binding protein [Eubacterium sp.]